MIARQKWVDHKFNLGIDIGWTQNVLSRVQDTIIRLEYYCKDLSEEQLSGKINNAWSIKEHIGHLADLEELWAGRFKEFAEGNAALRAADMSNKKTKQSNHNNQSLKTLLNNFKRERGNLLNVFNALCEKTQNHQAMHPRIKMLMRPVDLLFFIAEHDDHHMVSINQITNTF